MRVTSLWVYPVKSLGGAPVEEAVVEPWGLAGDRRWGLVDPTGGKVTAREVHGLLALRAVAVGAETIRVTDRDGASILVDAPVGVDPVPVTHSRQGRATPADDDVNEWLTRRVGAPVRLVWQQDPTMRTVDPEQGGMPGEHLSLADAGPLLLTSESSLAQLNAWVAAGADQPDVAATSAPARTRTRTRPCTARPGPFRSRCCASAPTSSSTADSRSGRTSGSACGWVTFTSAGAWCATGAS